MFQTCTENNAPDKVVQDRSGRTRGGPICRRSPTLKIINRYCTKSAEIDKGRVIQTHPARGSCPTHKAHRRFNSDYHQSSKQSRRGRRIHQWAFPPSRQRCLARTSRGFGGRYAECWQVEVANDARALRQSRDCGTGRGRKVFLWKREIGDEVDTHREPNRTVANRHLNATRQTIYPLCLGIKRFRFADPLNPISSTRSRTLTEMSISSTSTVTRRGGQDRFTGIRPNGSMSSLTRNTKTGRS